MNWALLQNSLWVALLATVLAVGLGVVVALWLATLKARWRMSFLGLVVVALALPPFLVTNCWIDLLGERGLLRPWLPLRIYSLGGTVWILSLMLWPITVFAALSAWRRVQPAQLECEPALSGWPMLRWLLIPIAKGELTVAAILTFVLALNNFAVPAILQTKVLPDEMWVQFNTTFFQSSDGRFDYLQVLRLSAPLVIAPVLLIVWTIRRSLPWPRLQSSVSARIFRRQLGDGWRVGCSLVAIVLVVVSVLVPLGQIMVSPRTWMELSGAVEASARTIWNSVLFAGLTASGLVAVALAMGSSSTQWKPRGSGMLTSIAFGVAWMPFFFPGVLIGIALIHVFNRGSQPLWVAFYQSIGIALLALAVRYFAVAWTAVRHALGAVDRDLIDAARLEGATRWKMFRFVIWPQAFPQILAAWYVVYLLCLWDVESIVVIQPPGGETLALKIFNLLHYGHAGQVNALCLSLLGLALFPLLGWGMWKVASECSQKRLRKLQRRAVTRIVLSGVLIAIGIGASGCSPGGNDREARLRSKLFERAMVIGKRGVGIGEFNKPRSVTCDSSDNFYVVDMTGRVQKFSPDGEFMITWQMPETDLGKPKGMGRDGEGNILVIEPHYQRVNHFRPDGTLVAQWGCKGTNEGCFTLPRGIAQNSRGEFLVSEYMGAERVQRFGLAKSHVSGTSASREKFHTATNWPYAKTDPAMSAKSVLDDSGGESWRETTLLQVIGRPGTAPGEFNRAEGIGVDAQDRLYVADSCNHRIQIFSADGKFIRQYGKAGSGLGELSYPYDIAVDGNGYQFVCEFGNSRIQVFNTNCEPVEIIGGAGVTPGKFNNPWGVALDSRGNLYVADALNHRVQKLVRTARAGTL